MTADVMVRAGDRDGVTGVLIDVSSRGAGLITAAPLPNGARVSIAISRSRAAAVYVDGKVTSCRDHADAPGVWYRIGVEFTGRQRDLAERLTRATERRALGTGAADVPVGLDADDGSGPTLAATGEGRERLYQHALRELEQGRFDQARRAALWAIQGDPRAPAYRLLFHRAVAELALSRGEHRAARREIARALALAPDDPSLQDLAARVKPRPGPLRRWLASARARRC